MPPILNRFLFQMLMLPPGNSIISQTGLTLEEAQELSLLALIRSLLGDATQPMQGRAPTDQQYTFQP